MNNNTINITYDMLIWIAFIITLISQLSVSIAYSKYKKK